MQIAISTLPLPLIGALVLLWLQGGRGGFRALRHGADALPQSRLQGGERAALV